MKNSRYFVALVLLVLFFPSCKEEENIDFQPKDTSKIVYDRQSELKRVFATSLAQALKDSQPLRDLIKQEAIKMFDNDYDVLYQLIKNERLPDGKTVEELLLQHCENEKEFLEIETEIPTLTIFVPELPDDRFSAKIWDIQTELPHVAFNVNSTNDVPVIDSDGKEYVLKGDIIPGFPVVVIKVNERVVLNDNIGKNSISSRNSEQNIISSSEGITFRFLDDSFNSSLTKKNSNERNYQPHEVDPKLIEAYNIYSNADGWQRDYIYYGITPTSPRGPFSYAFKEHITSFKMMGGTGSNYGVIAYNKISDQTGDPKIGIAYKEGIATVTSGWTDGNFEFKVKVLLNAKNGVGSELVTYFPADPRDLFYVRTTTPEGKNFTVQQLRPRAINLHLGLFNWDLNQYASSIKIDIEEVDRTQTVSRSDTRTVKFATNFGLEATVLKKIGLKFGGSYEETKTQTVQTSYTEGNDELGSVIINFADNFIRPYNFDRNYATSTYATGWYEISFEPKRVQW